MNDYPAGTYNKVLILTKPNPDEVTNYIGSEVVKFCEENDVKWSFTPAMYKDDSERLMIVAIGGDGTMLGAMRLSLELEGSFVYGINTGSLGFLSENISCINGITKIFSNIGRGFGVMEERMALTAEVSMDGEFLARDLDAMNEFVLAPMTIQSPLVTEVFINNKFVSSNQGSGVLVASSTGSTAMALSGGGAIVNFASISGIHRNIIKTQAFSCIGSPFIFIFFGSHTHPAQSEPQGSERERQGCAPHTHGNSIMPHSSADGVVGRI